MVNKKFIVPVLELPHVQWQSRNSGRQQIHSSNAGSTYLLLLLGTQVLHVSVQSCSSQSICLEWISIEKNGAGKVRFNRSNEWVLLGGNRCNRDKWWQLKSETTATDFVDLFNKLGRIISLKSLKLQWDQMARLCIQ